LDEAADLFVSRKQQLRIIRTRVIYKIYTFVARASARGLLRSDEIRENVCDDRRVRSATLSDCKKSAAIKVSSSSTRKAHDSHNS